MKKMEILNRLIKDGAIDLEEALILLEAEVKIIEKEKIIYRDGQSPFRTEPFRPHAPLQPNPYTWPPQIKPFLGDILPQRDPREALYKQQIISILSARFAD